MKITEEIRTLRNEIEGFVSAGAGNREILRETLVSSDGLLDVVRVLLEELRDYEDKAAEGGTRTGA